jgi:hypothetical protein
MKLHTLTNGTTTIKVGADTVERAIAKCSSLDQWRHVATEEVPYVHEPAVKAIAAALGPNWRTKPISDERPDCNIWLVRDDGLTLYSTSPDRYGQKGRWTFGLFLPNGYHYNRVNSVNISASKTPPQIAKGIHNRLLPQAEAAFAKTNAEIEKERKHNDRRSETFAQLVEHLGAKATHQNLTDFRVYFPNGQAEVGFDGTIQVSLTRLQTDEAKRILSSL